jgi:hypothetical protein
MSNGSAWWSVLLSGAILACSGDPVGTNGPAHAASPLRSPLSACTWPASLGSADAASGSCAPARAYLNCEEPGGIVQACTSDDGIQCSSTEPTASGASGSATNPTEPDASLTCVNQCDANEYVVECGSAGPAPSPPSPPGCRSLPSGPGGGVSGCCPCGSKNANVRSTYGQPNNGESYGFGRDAVALSALAPCAVPNSLMPRRHWQQTEM